MRRTIQKFIEDPLSQMIIEGSAPEGVVIADHVADTNELTFRNPERQLAEAAAGGGDEAGAEG